MIKKVGSENKSKVTKKKIAFKNTFSLKTKKMNYLLRLTAPDEMVRLKACTHTFNYGTYTRIAEQ